MKRLVTTVALALVVLTGRAAAWTGIPETPQPRRVAVAAVPDTYGPVRDFLHDFRSSVGAEYYVLVVAHSDASDRDGPEHGDESGAFIDAVVNAWQPHVDAERGVIVALAVRNHDIIVHPFSRWAALGFERDEVVRVIDESPFGVHARSGNYSRAIVELIHAIDRELASRVAAEERGRTEAGRLLESTRRWATSFDTLARTVSFHVEPERAQRDHAVRDAHVAFSQGGAGVDRARLAERDAREAYEQLLGLVASERSARTALASLPARARRFEERLGHAGIDSPDARDHLGRAKRKIAAADRALRGGHPDAAQTNARGAESELYRADVELRADAHRHHFMTRTLPPFAIAVLLLLLAALVVVLRLRRSAKAREAEGVIREWELLLARAGGNLVELENAHPLVLGRPDLAQRFIGESVDPVRRAARLVDDLFLSFDVAQKRLLAAKASLDGGGPLGWLSTRWVTRALSLLRDEEVVARTEDVTVRRLFLPEKREVRMKPRALLDEMDRAYDEATDHVEKLEKQLREAWDAIEAASESLRATTAAMTRAQERGLTSCAAFDEERAAAEREHAEVRASATLDPVGATRAAKALVERIASLHARAERIAEAVERATATEPYVLQTRRTVERARAEGHAVAEPGFEPEAMLDHAAAAIRQAQDAARAGEDERALASANESQETVEELRELLEATSRSRSESPQRIQEQSTRLFALRERAPERRARLEALRAEHSDDSLRSTLDNVEEALPAIDHALACLREAEGCVSPSAQRFLAAAELLRRASDTLDAVDALYAEIDRKAEDLAEQRAQALARADEARGKIFEVDSLVEKTGSDAFASQATVEALGSSRNQLLRLREAHRGSRPSWPSLLDTGARLADLTAGIADRARLELAAFEEAKKIGPAAAALREDVAAMLAKSSSDRADANRTAAEGIALHDQALAGASTPHPDWIELRAKLERTRTLLEGARALAERDESAAKAAREAVAAAEDALRNADRPFGYDVYPDIAQARSQHAEALELLRAARYEDALQRALAARAEAQQQRELAEQAAAARALGGTPFEDRPSRPYRTRPASGSGGFSFGSGSSPSRRSSGLSSSRSRSSFGSSSSSSGRSSFGSSSGRSSFGRSSGRSKW